MSRRLVTGIAILAGLAIVAVAAFVILGGGAWPDDPGAYIPAAVDGEDVSRDRSDYEAVSDALLDQMGVTEEDVEAAAGTIGNTAGFPDLILVALRPPDRKAAIEGLKEANRGEGNETVIDGVPVIVLKQGAEDFGVDVTTAAGFPRDDLLVLCVSLGTGDPFAAEPDEEPAGSDADSGTRRAVTCVKAMLGSAR